MISIVTRDEVSLNKKLSTLLLKNFAVAYKDNLNELSAIHLVKVLQKYSESHWMFSETYNSIIQALAANFNSLVPKEISSVCYSFSLAGIRQDDILNQSVERILVLSDPSGEKMRTSFNKVIIPMVQAYTDLNLITAEGSLFSKLVSDEYIQATTIGGITLMEQAKRV